MEYRSDIFWENATFLTLLHKKKLWNEPFAFL